MTSKKNEDNWRELDSLITLFEDTLRATTKARNILTLSSQETLSLLTNWEVPGDEYEEPVCTCNIISSKGEEELNKIIRNVEQAVENAQKIREKPVSQSRLKVKQEDISPTASCTYTTAELENVHRTSLASKLGTTTQGNTLPKSRVTSKVVTQKISGNTMLRLSTKSSKIQTTYQKDFLVPSKMPHIRQQSSSTRLCSRKEISAQDSYKLKEDESSSKPIPLRNLQRLSSPQRPFTSNHNESNKFNSISTDQACEQLRVNTCPVHGNGKLPQKQSCSVNLEKAVDILGVHPEMVKHLRSYHSFVTRFQFENKPIKMSNGKRAAEKFIGQLVEVCSLQDFRLTIRIAFVPVKRLNEKKRQVNITMGIKVDVYTPEAIHSEAIQSTNIRTMYTLQLHLCENENGWQWKGSEQEPLGTLFQEYVPLFTEVFGTKELSSNIEDRMRALDERCLEWFNLNESVDPNVSSVDRHKIHSPLQDKMLLNGIWNFKNKQRSEVLQYIRYSSPGQWRKFFKNIQDIQRLELQLQVFTELESIVPLLETCSPDDPSFILLFKAICTICDITKLCLPVIFKS